jgi:L-alanine-DL-glutamate epimerase-like enolase superfamily enzyme
VRDEVEHQGDSGAVGLGTRRCRDAEGVTATTATAGAGPSIERLTAAAYTVPTDRPESDGTLEWDSTTIVVVEVSAGDETGIGWTYGAAAIERLIGDVLAPVVEEVDALAVGTANLRMREALRNVGEAGAGAMALSAIDVALWDLKAKLLDLSVASLLGPVHAEVPVYGSGGFCSYTPDELIEQFAGWVEEGILALKMKVGREPAEDLERVRVAREAIWDGAELFVDANGALTVKQALRFAEQCAELDVRWFEEPVSSRNLDGLRLVRDRAPAGMDVAVGEYASTLDEFLRLADAVDCLQADATRCGGITGLLCAAAIAEAHELDLSGHCAPTIHAHALAAVPRLRHLEWFHDHVRVERLLFDGVLEPEGGVLRPDPDRPGLGVELKRVDAERYAA